MDLETALVSWAIVALSLGVLGTVAVAYARSPHSFGTTGLLLAAVVIQAFCCILETVYFGFARPDAAPASNSLPMLPLLIDLAAAGAVLGLLGLRWLPQAGQERAKAQRELDEQSSKLAQESEERRRLFETSLDLILVTDREGNLLRVSPSSEAILGYTPEEMTGRNGGEFVAAEDLEAVRAEMRLARRGKHLRNFETRYAHKNGRIVTLAWSGVWSEPEQRHFFFGRDMTERKVAEEKLLQIAHYDQLTGLPNRVTFRNDLAELLAGGAAGEERAATVAIFDLDGFKDINDTLGHATGDRLLRAVSERLRAASAPMEARVYRPGGDEFVLLVPHCSDPRSAAKIVEAMLQRLSECFEVDEQKFFLGASVGIAIAPLDSIDADELLASADLALYDAKATGGRTYRLFVPMLRAKAQARRALDGELRCAFANDEFVLHYQPQLRIGDGAVVGAEALLRWKHPERGLLAPAAFIDALAESPVALDAGRWILRTACFAAASWRAQGHAIRIGVNLFPAQFHSGTLLEDVEAALVASGLPADALELEITENTALAQDEAMLAPLQALRKKGVGLAFDDFGTGYASLSYLTRYPLSRIKIDRSFVKKYSEQSTTDDMALVRSIIFMAHNLGLEVTAEGVELPVQAAFLQAEKCDEAQGYYYAKPLAPVEFEAYVRANASSQAA